MGLVLASAMRHPGGQLRLLGLLWYLFGHRPEQESQLCRLLWPEHGLQQHTRVICKLFWDPSGRKMQSHRWKHCCRI